MPGGNSESMNSNPGHLWSEDLRFPSGAEDLGQITGELKARVLLPLRVVGAVVKPDIGHNGHRTNLYIFLSSWLDHTNMLQQSISHPSMS